jgi:CBS domain containing-hemolysin-like protein
LGITLRRNTNTGCRFSDLASRRILGEAANDWPGRTIADRFDQTRPKAEPKLEIAALTSARRSEIKPPADSGNARAQIVPKFHAFPERLYSVTQIGITWVTIVASPIRTTVGEVVEGFRKFKHPRLPVHDGTIDSIVGILCIK